MSYRLFSTGKASALFGESPVIPAQDFEGFRKACDLLERSAIIHADAGAAYAEAIEEGRRQGRAQALAERDDHIATQLATIAETIARAEAERREDIATLALHALRHMLGDCGEELVTAGLVQSAVDRLPLDAIDSIRVAPDLVDPLAARLSEELAGKLRGDPVMKPGDCIVHAESGQVIASVDLQLQRLEERWLTGAAT